MTIQLKGDVPVEYCRKVMADLDRAVAAGRYLSVIFYVEPKGSIRIQWVAENFPHGDYATCQKLFAEQCDKHGGLSAPLEPLPRANPEKFDLAKVFQRPMVSDDAK